MHIELVDQLRCVEPHEDSWLIARFDRMEGRTVLAGTLGCPVCGAEYPIVDGVAWFGARPGDPLPAATPEASTGVTDDPEETMRLAALLGLVGPGGVVMLGGGWGSLGAALARLVQVQVLLVDPPAGVGAGEGGGSVRTDGRVPLASASLRGAAVDGAALAAAAVDRLRGRGRLVAPAGVPVPPGVAELARDERHWVAEKQAAPSALVPLKLAKSD